MVYRIDSRVLAGTKWAGRPARLPALGPKVSNNLVAGMVCGADSIDDMVLLRHGGMGRLFADVQAPSTLGTFLRLFTFGHGRGGRLSSIRAMAFLQRQLESRCTALERFP